VGSDDLITVCRRNRNRAITVSRDSIGAHRMSFSIKSCTWLQIFGYLRSSAGYPGEDLADSEQVAYRCIHARDWDFADPVGLDLAWSPVSHVPGRLDVPPIGCDS
jgi:hypothetical protein